MGFNRLTFIMLYALCHYLLGNLMLMETTKLFYQLKSLLIFVRFCYTISSKSNGVIGVTDTGFLLILAITNIELDSSI